MVNGSKRIRATPAGNAINVRTTGKSRLKNTASEPQRSKNRSATSSSCGAIRTQRPYRSRNRRPPVERNAAARGGAFAAVESYLHAYLPAPIAKPLGAASQGLVRLIAVTW